MKANGFYRHATKYYIEIHMHLNFFLIKNSKEIIIIGRLLQNNIVTIKN